MMESKGIYRWPFLAALCKGVLPCSSLSFTPGIRLANASTCLDEEYSAARWRGVFWFSSRYDRCFCLDRISSKIYQTGKINKTRVIDQYFSYQELFALFNYFPLFCQMKLNQIHIKLRPPKKNNFYDRHCLNWIRISETDRYAMELKKLIIRSSFSNLLLIFSRKVALVLTHIFLLYINFLLLYRLTWQRSAREPYPTNPLCVNFLFQGDSLKAWQASWAAHFPPRYEYKFSWANRSHSRLHQV